MKKAILTLGVAFFAFTGVFAQVETGTMQEEESGAIEKETPIEDNQNLDTQSPEDITATPTEAEQTGKVKITYDELPAPIKSEYKEAEVVEAYKVKADPATGETEAKFEVKVKDEPTAQAKVVTFDEKGKELKNSESSDSK